MIKFDPKDPFTYESKLRLYNYTYQEKKNLRKFLIKL